MITINSVHTELVHELIMAESETGFSDLMNDLDLDKTYDTGYEEDIEVEIIDGFYHQNVAFINERSKYSMKLHSNCCLQRDYAVESLDNKKPDAAKLFFEIGPVRLEH